MNKIKIPITMSDRSPLIEHLGFWAMHFGFSHDIKNGDTVQFMFHEQVFLEGTVYLVEEPGTCIDQKFEYFRNVQKIWFTVKGDEENCIKPDATHTLDWTGISPISRVNGTPNNWKGMINETKRHSKNRRSKSSSTHGPRS